MYISKEEFINLVSEGVKERLGPDYNVKVIESFKSNDKPCHHLIAYKNTASGCPAIVLDDAYNHYRHGIRIDNICTLIVAAIKDDNAIKALDTKWYLDYDKACDRICYKLINRERNLEYLKDKPFIPFLDLAIVFYAPVTQAKKQVGTITVTNQHLQAWGVTTKDLMNAAEDNSERTYPSVFCNAGEIHQGALKDVLPDPDDNERIMYIGTNEFALNGAAVILYDGFLDQVYDTLGMDFYVAFSSVHEVVIWPALAEFDVNQLQEMIREINATVVNPEEVLSDHLYKYDHIAGELVICR